MSIIATRKYSINENYFEQLDSEEKVYWLGFLFADGNIRNNKKQLELALNYEDENHIQKMLDCMESNYTIYETRKDLRRVVIWSPKLCSDLISYGCIPNKSLIKKFPYKIPYSLVHHFIRGYFDGNGCIGFDICNKSTYIQFTSTEDFLNGIINVLDLKQNKLKQNGSVNNFTLKYQGKYCSEVLNKLYNGATIYLDRKHEIYSALEGVDYVSR